MNQTLRYFSLVALIGLASAGSAFAADLPKEGSFISLAAGPALATPSRFPRPTPRQVMK
jgi:hypothetical protein